MLFNTIYLNFFHKVFYYIPGHSFIEEQNIMTMLTLKLIFCTPRPFVGFYFLFYLTCVFIFYKARVSSLILKISFDLLIQLNFMQIMIHLFSKLFHGITSFRKDFYFQTIINLFVVYATYIQVYLYKTKKSVNNNASHWCFMGFLPEITVSSGILFVLGVMILFLLFFKVFVIFFGSDKNFLDYLRNFIQQVKEKLRPILVRYMLFREKVLLILLTKNKISSWILVRWFSVVMVYKYVTQDSLAHIPPEWFSIPTLFYGILCTSTHHDSLFALSMVIIIRFEMSSMLISRFYLVACRRTGCVDRLSRSAAIQTASVGLSGLAMWKYFDYRDTKIDADPRQLDRNSENERHKKGLVFFDIMELQFMNFIIFKCKIIFLDLTSFQKDGYFRRIINLFVVSLKHIRVNNNASNYCFIGFLSQEANNGILFTLGIGLGVIIGLSLGSMLFPKKTPDVVNDNTEALGELKNHISYLEEHLDVYESGLTSLKGLLEKVMSDILQSSYDIITISTGFLDLDRMIINIAQDANSIEPVEESLNSPLELFRFASFPLVFSICSALLLLIGFYGFIFTKKKNMSCRKLKIELSNGINTMNAFTLSINTASFGYHLLFICFVSLATLFIPMSWLIFVLPVTILSVPLGFTAWIQPYFYAKINVIKPILALLQALGILRSLMNLHAIVFYSRDNIYWFFVVFCYGFTAIYVLASRYNFYHRIILKEHLTLGVTVFLAFLLFLGFLGSYVRLLIGFSTMLVVLVRQHSPELLDPLLRVEPVDFPSGSTQSIFGFSWNSHQHTHNYPPKPKMSNWGKVGILLTAGTFVLGAGSYYHLSRQTTELVRQNDLEEVAQGLRSKESYLEKYKTK